LEAAHSVLLTDETEPVAHKASALIELHHAGLCRVAFTCTAEPRQKLRVIALHDAGQFEQLYGSEASGAFSPELIYEPQLVLATGLSQAGVAQLSRALTGMIAQQTLGPVPAWLLSGLASYFETAHFDAGGAFVIGDPVRRHVELLAAGKRLRSEALLTKPPSAASDPVFAASSWLLVHYLQSERRADFAALLSSIASGQPLAAAFHEAFPELAPELLDGLLDRYQRAGSYLTQSKRLDPQPSAASLQPLSDADVYSLRAEVAAAGHSERSAELLNQALSKDPKHVRASLLRAGDRSAPGLLAAHPESWLAWVHTAYIEPARACAAELRDHLQAIAPDNAHTLSLAATCAQQAGQTDQALSLSKRAFGANPLSLRITLAHARILHAAGACAELAILEENAFGLDPASPEQAALTALGECHQR
jgi:tetratricopeptide (TPR) repeat protein